MSGGFFRGTSADQDTRFSNKQAKLMKSQKFPPELEHLVDMKKVKMDVIRPWIANRVTELLGFEDEVLINFIYGLLDAKDVNGKEVQISLTGFMEKNTGKFMKELWTLLLSAQKNESGVPQQFLDAKEEETRKKQAEVDRITNEIQRKKEKESKELERERPKKMDGGAQMKSNFDALESASKHLQKNPSGYREDEKEASNRNGTRRRNRFSRSPQSAGHSSSPRRGSPSRGTSEKRKSRSLSRSPEALKRAISPDGGYRSARKRSTTPRRRYPSRGSRSPSRRISSYSRQRSRSPSLRRSPSPVRRRLRSPIRRRSPSPIRRRRSPSPVRRRRSPSPVRRRRSPSPVRRRRSPSPVRRRRSPSPIGRRRSPSPIRRRRSPSPLKRRRSPSPMSRISTSPIRRGRSPMLTRRRSPPAMRRRSPIPRRRSPSPVRNRYQRSPSSSLGESPSIRHRSPNPAQRRSPIASPPRCPSLDGSSSPSPVRHRIHSAVRRSSKEHRMSPAESPEQRVSTQEKSFAVPRRPTSSLRSPQRDVKAVSPSPRRFPAHSESPPIARTRNSREDRRSNSPHKSPVRQRGARRNRSTSSSGSPVRQRKGRTTDDASLSPPLRPKVQQGYNRTPESSKEDEDSDYARGYKARSSQKRPVDSSITNKQKDTLAKVQSKDENSERVPSHLPTESHNHLDIVESRRRDQEIKSEKGHPKKAHPQTPERHISPETYKESLVERQPISHAGGQTSDEKDRLRSNDVKDNDKHNNSEIRQLVVEKVDQSNGDGAFDSGTEGSGKRRTDSKGKRKHKRSHREEVDSDNDDSDDSEIEEKKEVKRRRKEEKKQRKEEKRRRREERRRRKEERRAEKRKRKDPNVTSSSDDEHSGRRDSHPSDGEDTHSEQKKLEIELRKKAIESLKAKKGISH